MVQNELVQLDQCGPDSVLADVPVRSPRELAVAERGRARQSPETVIHAEGHHRSDEHLPAIPFGRIATHQMGEVAEATGPPIDLVQQVGERNERDAPFKAPLQLLGRVADDRLESGQMQLTVLIDVDVLEAFDVLGELRQQFCQVKTSGVEVFGGGASEREPSLPGVLEFSPMFSAQQVALERLIATAADHVEVARTQPIVQRLESSQLVHARVDGFAALEYQSTPTFRDVIQWRFHGLATQP